MDKDKIIKVKNRDNGVVGYTIPDLGNLHRNYQPGEEKEITFDELRKLANIPGGIQILKNYLIIKDDEAIKELLGAVEPEYNYTEKEVNIILSPSGTLAQLEDTLNFAPKGVIELVKTLAVELEISDINKRELIHKKTGFDVSKAIEINKESRELGEENKNEKVRKATPIVETSESSEEKVRQTTPLTESEYKVVEK